MSEVITEKLGSSYVAWFERSNSWIQLEEPAWKVFDMLRNGFSGDAIIQQISHDYQVDAAEGQKFVSDIRDRLDKFQKQQAEQPASLMPDHVELPDNNAYSVRYYAMGKHSFQVQYGSRNLEYFVHPPLAHLESRRQNKKAAFNCYHLIESESGQHFLHALHSGKKFRFEEYGSLKMRMFIELTNLLNNKDNDDWMTILHASGISDGKSALLFTGESGSGKSILAALLQSGNYDLMGDDFIPLEYTSGLAYPFPGGISIKEGGLDVLENHGSMIIKENMKKLEGITPGNVIIPPERRAGEYPTAAPVKGLVFLKYNPSDECNLKPLERINAYRRIHNLAWISDKAEYVREFIKWLNSTPCFEMSYGDTQKGLSLVDELFKQVDSQNVPLI